MPFNVNIKVKKRSTAEALYKVFTKIKGKKEEEEDKVEEEKVKAQEHKPIKRQITAQKVK